MAQWLHLYRDSKDARHINQVRFRDRTRAQPKQAVTPQDGATKENTMSETTMERPRCGWRNGVDCQRPAKWVAVFLDDYRARFSCDDHRDEWNRHGRGTIIAEIKGWQPSTSIEEIFAGNQAAAEEKRDRILAEFARRTDERHARENQKKG